MVTQDKDSGGAQLNGVKIPKVTFLDMVAALFLEQVEKRYNCPGFK